MQREQASETEMMNGYLCNEAEGHMTSKGNKCRSKKQNVLNYNYKEKISVTIYISQTSQSQIHNCTEKLRNEPICLE